MNKQLQKILNGIMNPADASLKLSDAQSKQLQCAVTNVRNRYGDAASFLTTFNKEIQPAVAANCERAYLGNAPTLTLVRESYNAEVLVTWIMAQLENLNDYIGVNRKMDIAQMEELAIIISQEFHYLKVTELHLFLYRLKSGRYGEFYGTIDPMRIMAALQRFASERVSEISRFERIRKEKEMDDLRKKWAAECVTREEYEKMKKQKI